MGKKKSKPKDDPFARRIIHIDMDAFYAAIEMRENPQYRRRPLVVGGLPDKRGTVATCNYKAREYGIHSAMASATARRLCPDVVFIRPRFELYKAVSHEIKEIFFRYTEKVEPLSLDEAYLDVTGCRLFGGVATDIAKDIRRSIREKTGLTSSAGVSYNKFLAKIASEINKPNGMRVVRPREGPGLVAALPIGKFHGIGPATEARLRKHKVRTGADLKAWPKERVMAFFGKHGEYYYQACRGLDMRPVQPHRERKSVGSEVTFLEDLKNTGEMLEMIRLRAWEVAQDLQTRNLAGKTITVKVKFSDFKQIARSRSLHRPFSSYEEMAEVLPLLLEKAEINGRSVRLLGVTVTNLVPLTESGELEQKFLL